MQRVLFRADRSGLPHSGPAFGPHSQFSQAAEPSPLPASLQGESIRSPITNSFASYRRAYNDYSNRPRPRRGTPTSGASRYRRILPRHDSTCVMRGECHAGRLRSWKARPVRHQPPPLPLAEPICEPAEPLGKACSRPRPRRIARPFPPFYPQRHFAPSPAPSSLHSFPFPVSVAVSTR